MDEMSREQRRRQIDHERGSGLIRSYRGPHLLPCCWTECDRPARREHMSTENEPWRTMFFFFCSERHQMLWRNAPKSMGNLAVGSKGLII